MRPRVVLAVGVCLWLGGALLTWFTRSPLGHDEAQYALAARDLITGEPLRWSYLSIGMVVSAIPAMLLGGNELTLRALPVLAGLALVLASARTARRLAGEATAPWMPAVLAATICFARRGAENLSDLPATACLLMATCLVLEELTTEDGPRWRLVAAAPWLALAFYLRYGSLLPIAVLSGVAVLGGWRSIARRPAPVAATLALGAALAIPHVLVARGITGSALGILHESAEAVPDQFGLWTYVTSNPLSYYGTLATPLLLLGLGSVAWRRDRRSVMMWAVAVADIVVVGMTTLGQSRYIFLGLTLLLILGTREVVEWVGARAARPRWWLAAAATAALALAWVGVLLGILRVDQTRRKNLAGVLEASAIIRSDAAGAPCLAMARRTTVTEWYSGCLVVSAVTPEMLRTRHLYLVVQPGRPEQPMVLGLPATQQVLLDRPGLVTVTRYEMAPGT